MKYLTLIVALLLTLSGCKAKPVADIAQTRPLTGIASAIARADVRADTIIEASEQFERYAPKDLAAFMAEQARGVKAEVHQANVQLNKANDAAATAQEQLKEANRRLIVATEYWGYRWGKKIDKALVWLSIALAVAVVFRALSLVLVGNPAGKVLAFISTAIFGVLTCGVSLIQSGADNFYFRKLAPGSQ